MLHVYVFFFADVLHYRTEDFLGAFQQFLIDKISEAAIGGAFVIH